MQDRNRYIEFQVEATCKSNHRYAGLNMLLGYPYAQAPNNFCQRRHLKRKSYYQLHKKSHLFTVYINLSLSNHKRKRALIEW